jgi:RNA polymerase sigma factor (sigma-70 family)
MFNGRRRFSTGEKAPGLGAGALARSARAEAIARLYEREAGTVRRLVARRAQVPEVVLEDACQTAWERLCSHEDVSLTPAVAVRWLVVTATRVAWRHGRREVPVGAAPQELGRGVLPDATEAVIAREELQELVACLDVLTERERRFLALQAAGLSYREIGERTGATVRTVERQLRRGRSKLNQAAGR